MAVVLSIAVMAVIAVMAIARVVDPFQEG